MILSYKNKKSYSFPFFLLLISLFSMGLFGGNKYQPKTQTTSIASQNPRSPQQNAPQPPRKPTTPKNPQEEKKTVRNAPDKPTIKTLFTQGVMGYLSQRYNLGNKSLYDINLEEYLPSELMSENMPTISITQQKVLSLALTYLIFPHLGIASSLSSIALMSGAHGIGYHFTGTLLGRPFGYIAQKIGKTPILGTLAYGQPHWLLKYPVALPRWFVKSSVQGSIQGSLYGSMLRAPSNILSKIRELRNKKQTEKTTENPNLRESIKPETKQPLAKIPQGRIR